MWSVLWPRRRDGGRHNLIRVGILSRSSFVRKGLQQALEASGYPLSVVAGAEASAVLESHPDVVVIDYSEPLYLDLLQQLEDRNLALVAIGAPADFSTRITNLRGWATLGNEFADEALLGSVLTAYAGLVTRERQEVEVSERTVQPTENLTPREREILQLMSEGQANKQIAGRLGLSIHTVKFHIASLLVKLGASSRTEAVTLGIRQGLVVL